MQVKVLSRTALLIAGLVAIVFAVSWAGINTVGAASSTELVTNGDFEAGSSSGWTVTTSRVSPTRVNWVINDGTVNPLYGPHGPSGPISGAYDALSLGNGGGWERLSQSVTLPSDIVSATISWNDIIRSATAFEENPPGRVQEFRVVLRDGAGALIAEVWSTEPGDPPVQLGPNARSFDITALAQTLEGQPVSLSIEQSQCCWHFNTNVDDVSFLVDTVSTKADILAGSGVHGKGLEKAPGLQKEFNSKSKAADNAGKK